jgi:hypothetical protein
MPFRDLPAIVPMGVFALLAWEWFITQRRVRRIEDLPEPGRRR